MSTNSEQKPLITFQGKVGSFFCQSLLIWLVPILISVIEPPDKLKLETVSLSNFEEL